MKIGAAQGTILSVEHFSLHNGPGIRSTLFMKGCPLRCLWCGNPESHSRDPELVYNRDLCMPVCNECIAVCPHGVVNKAPDGRVDIDWTILKSAAEIRACAQICPPGALSIVGEVLDASTATDRLLVDRPFYEESGGGVTISGGEPLEQPDFVYEVLSLLKEKGTNTALDTSGYAEPPVLDRIASVSDLILFDFKESDPALHERWTGRDNTKITRNLRHLLETRMQTVRVRFPFIPAFNGTKRRIDQTATQLRGMGVQSLDLLPYHRYGAGKYTQIGRQYTLSDLAVPTGDEVSRAVEQFAQYGITATIVG